MKLIVFIILTMNLNACVYYVYWADYEFSLAEVERPEDARDKYGPKEISSSVEGGVTKYYFSDSLLSIVWSVTQFNFSFLLTNNTDYSIKILWDECAYVDVNGVSHRLVHSGIKFTNKAMPQPPSTVVRRGMLVDTLTPAGNIIYDDINNKWIRSPLIPSYNKKLNVIRPAAFKIVGKSMQVLLAIKIEDIINEYIFTFNIDKLTHIKKVNLDYAVEKISL